MLDDSPGGVRLSHTCTNHNLLLLKFCYLSLLLKFAIQVVSHKHNSDESANSFLNHDIVSQNPAAMRCF